MVDFDEGNPTDSAIVSGFPANERAARAALNTAWDVEHDEAGGRHKIGVGNDATRDAITNWVIGGLWISTQSSDTVLQRVISIDPDVWETITATPGDLSVTTAKIAANAVTGAKIAMGSDAQGDILKYGGTDYERLAAGTSGHILKTKGAGADPAWEALSGSLITAGTNLTLNPWSGGSTTTQGHGLGAEPFLLKVILENLTAEHGYTAGDRIILPLHAVSGAAVSAYSITIDATNVILRTTSAQLPTITKKSDNSSGGITAAKWKCIITPYIFAAAT